MHGQSKNSAWLCGLLLLVVMVGFAARLWIATFGNNYDLESYKVVSDIADHGGNVYASTDRYNYGPIWFYVLHGLQLLAGHNETVFRYLVSGFLSLVDAGIFFVLWRKYGKVAAVYFFLNPISIIITGYHSQFDNLAVLLGLWSVLLVKDEFDQPIGRRKFWGLVVLGLSLTTKHVLFAFPFWLAVKQKGMRQKLWVILIPVSIFALSFVPYWHAGSQGIIQNVFRYQSPHHHYTYFYNLFVPALMKTMLDSRTAWYFALAIFAFVCKQKNAIESLLFYTCVVVATSPATANQYLAIPVAFAVTHVNPFTIMYTVTGMLHLLVDDDGLHLTGPFFGQFTGNSQTPIIMLCFGLIWAAWRENLIAWLRKSVSEARSQFGCEK